MPYMCIKSNQDTEWNAETFHFFAMCSNLACASISKQQKSAAQGNVEVQLS